MIDSLLQRFQLISDQVSKQEVRIILRELQSVLDAKTHGDVVEMGCYVGTTSLFISRLLKAGGYQCSFHVYDSFQGLPEKSHRDNSPAGEQFRTGELAASKQQFIKEYKKAGLPLPHLHKAWFYELSQQDMPQAIAFAFLDGDYYESIRDSLSLVTPALSEGARIIVDDYGSSALPGAAIAVDEWLKRYPSAQLRVEQTLAVIRFQ